jgi:tuftelin-interacting protein 11
MQHFSRDNYSESEEEGPRRGLGKFESRRQHGLNLDGEIAGLRKKRLALNPTIMNKGMGTWEKHTRGIGAKLLLQVCLKLFIM